MLQEHFPLVVSYNSLYTKEKAAVHNDTIWSLFLSCLLISCTICLHSTSTFTSLLGMIGPQFSLLFFLSSSSDLYADDVCDSVCCWGNDTISSLHWIALCLRLLGELQCHRQTDGDMSPLTNKSRWTGTVSVLSVISARATVGCFQVSKVQFWNHAPDMVVTDRDISLVWWVTKLTEKLTNSRTDVLVVRN